MEHIKTCNKPGVLAKISVFKFCFSFDKNVFFKNIVLVHDYYVFSIFYKKFNLWRKYFSHYIFDKNSIYEENIFHIIFLTKISIYGKIPFMTKISIFDKMFDLSKTFNYLQNKIVRNIIIFLAKISIYVKISIFGNKIYLWQNFDLWKKIYFWQKCVTKIGSLLEKWIGSMSVKFCFTKKKLEQIKTRVRSRFFTKINMTTK